MDIHTPALHPTMNHQSENSFYNVANTVECEDESWLLLWLGGFVLIAGLRKVFRSIMMPSFEQLSRVWSHFCVGATSPQFWFDLSLVRAFLLPAEIKIRGLYNVLPRVPWPNMALLAPVRDNDKLQWTRCELRKLRRKCQRIENVLFWEWHFYVG